MKKNLFAAGSLLLLVSCAGSASYENLPGHWIESMPANPQIVQGIRLDADGGAASIGMHTLRYVGWERHGDRLVLRGRSIGNGQTLDFSDTLEIIRLDADTMSLGKEGRYRVDYARADFMTSGGYSLLDSLAMPSSGSVLDIRRFGGLVQTLSGDAACTLTLYTYDNGGDADPVYVRQRRGRGLPFRDEPRNGCGGGAGRPDVYAAGRCDGRECRRVRAAAVRRGRDASFPLPGRPPGVARRGACSDRCLREIHPDAQVTFPTPRRS